MARIDPISGTALSVRDPEALAEEIGVIARVEGVNVSEVQELTDTFHHCAPIRHFKNGSASA
jgi:hypothetical protein